MNIQPAITVRPRFQASEYGCTEKLCTRCDDYWPADSEFYYSTSDGRLNSWCKACVNERRYEKRRATQ